MTIPKEGLEESNVVAFTSSTLKLLDSKLSEMTKEEVLPRLNSLSNLVFSQNYSTKTLSKLHLRLAYSLTLFAQEYNSVKTCDNVIEILTSEPQKSYLGTKYPYLYKYNLALAYFTRFNVKLREDDENILGKNELEDILTAKFYLLKIYDHHKSNKYIITRSQLYDTTTLLVSTLSQLSRWIEALDFIDREFGKDDEEWKLMIHYLKAKILHDVMDKTCLDYNGLLLLKILNHCQEGQKRLSNPKSNISKAISRIKQDVLERVATNNINLQSLTIHDQASHFKISELTQMECSLFELKLYLNEHRLYCSCEKSLCDDLQFQTDHKHTMIDYVANKGPLLDDILAEYTLARSEYFRSSDEWSLVGLSVNSFNKQRKFRKNIKISLLKSSFRRCYSILDSISTSILYDLNNGSEKVVDINDNPIKVYFLNLWDTQVVKDADYKRNQSLHALYSISRDLGQTRKSALKNFKMIRNTIEHKALQISNLKTDLKNGIINQEEMNYSTDLLLQITKSAIHSYVYFVRRESISKQ